MRDVCATRASGTGQVAGVIQAEVDHRGAPGHDTVAAYELALLPEGPGHLLSQPGRGGKQHGSY